MDSHETADSLRDRLTLSSFSSVFKSVRISDNTFLAVEGYLLWFKELHYVLLMLFVKWACFINHEMLCDDALPVSLGRNISKRACTDSLARKSYHIHSFCLRNLAIVQRSLCRHFRGRNCAGFIGVLKRNEGACTSNVDSFSC